MKVYQNLVNLILLIILATSLENCGGVKKIQELGLEAFLTNGNNVVLKTPKITFVVSPNKGGRVMSVIDNLTGLEILESYDERDPKIGGAFYDILDFIWPGTAERQYNLDSWGIDYDKKVVFAKVSYVVGSESEKARGLKVTKYLYANSYEPIIKALVTIENTSGVEKKFNYWHQTRPILEDVSNINKVIYLNIQGEAGKIPFEPGSGGRGDILTEANFFAFSSPNATNTLLITVDGIGVNHFWTWHDTKLPTFDIVFKEQSLKPGDKANYTIDWVLIPRMMDIVHADKTTSLVFSLDLPDKVNDNAKYKVNFGTTAYSAEVLEKIGSTIYVVFELQDSLGRTIGKVSETNKIEVIPFFLNNTKVDITIPSLRGGYYYVVSKVLDSKQNYLFSFRKSVKVKEIEIPNFTKTLRVGFIWTFHQPIYGDKKSIRQNINQFLPIYDKTVQIYSQRNTPVTINISGGLLYQLSLYFPKQLEGFKKLLKRPNVEPMLTSFSHSLLPFVSDAEAYRAVYLDKLFKENYLGIYGITGVWLPEMGFSEKVIFPLLQNGATWVPISDLAVDTGFAGWDINYFIPYRLISKAFSINTVIVNTKASRILYKKTDRSIDEFIQYLVEVNDKNKGNAVVVVADNGESIGDGVFLTKLLDKLEKIPWVKIVKVGDIFKEIPPVKDLLAEKIFGGWYYDPEEKKTTFRLWFDTPMKKKMWEICDSVASDVIKVVDRFKEAENVGVDLSFPSYLYDNAWNHLVISRDSGWIWMGSEVGLNRVIEEVNKSRFFLKDIYESLIMAIRGKISPVAEYITSNAQIITLDEFEKIKSEAKAKVANISDIFVRPRVPLESSFISVKVSIDEVLEFINFENSKIVFSISTEPNKYFIKDLNLDYNGEVIGYLGRAPSGTIIDIYVILESFSKKKQILGPISTKVE